MTLRIMTGVDTCFGTSDARDVKESAIAVITGNGGMDSPARLCVRSSGVLHEVK